MGNAIGFAAQSIGKAIGRPHVVLETDSDLALSRQALEVEPGSRVEPIIAQAPPQRVTSPALGLEIGFGGQAAFAAQSPEGLRNAEAFVEQGAPAFFQSLLLTDVLGETPRMTFDLICGGKRERGEAIDGEVGQSESLGRTSGLFLDRRELPGALADRGVDRPELLGAIECTRERLRIRRRLYPCARDARRAFTLQAGEAQPGLLLLIERLFEPVLEARCLGHTLADPPDTRDDTAQDRLVGRVPFGAEHTHERGDLRLERRGRLLATRQLFERTAIAAELLMQGFDPLERRKDLRREHQRRLPFRLPLDACECIAPLLLGARQCLARLFQPTGPGELGPKRFDPGLEPGDLRGKALDPLRLLLESTRRERLFPDRVLERSPFCDGRVDALLLAAGHEERSGLALETLDQLAQMDDAQSGPEERAAELAPVFEQGTRALDEPRMIETINMREHRLRHALRQRLEASDHPGDFPPLARERLLRALPAEEGRLDPVRETDARTDAQIRMGMDEVVG